MPHWFGRIYVRSQEERHSLAAEGELDERQLSGACLVTQNARRYSSVAGKRRLSATCFQCQGKECAHAHPPADRRESLTVSLTTKTNRSEYALAGDVVNLAARLAAASEKEGNGVLCDEPTVESLTGPVRSCYLLETVSCIKW